MGRKAMDKAKLEEAVAMIIEAIGEDQEREGLKDTPSRIAKMYGEIFSGIGQDAKKELTTGFEEGHQEMVVMTDIPFYSMCEHHFLPFHGKVHVGYIPHGRIVGVSKLARVVDIIAKRPQLQERLTSEIADTLMEGIQAVGVAVVVEAEHLCMTMRGIRKPGSRVVTSAMRGLFRHGEATRAEFFDIIHNHHS
jgi:GTP cyclohydrolase IA